MGSHPGHRCYLDHLRFVPHHADRNLGGYSKGMRQRAKVAAALVHDPTFLILDEPLNGTDPVQRAHLIERHGLTLLHLGQETDRDDEGRPWHNTVAVLGESQS